jgi:hypothetical protein
MIYKANPWSVVTFFNRITTFLLAVLINFTDVAMEAETDNNSKFLNK